MLDDQIRNLPVQLRLMRQKAGPWWSGLLLLAGLLLIGLGMYYATTETPQSKSAGISMERIRALPAISTDEFIAFLDRTGRSFSFKVHSNEIVVIHSLPAGSHKLYRLDYSGRSLEETEHILAERLE